MKKQLQKRSRRRYNWVIRTLENWADHWIRSARVHEIQTASQLWDKIMEGRQPKSTKAYMKLPSKNWISSHKIVNFPIMDDWQRHVQDEIRELSKAHQDVIFERYFGPEFDRIGYDEWARYLGVSRSTYGSRLKKAHQRLRDRLDGTLQEAIQTAKIS